MMLCDDKEEEPLMPWRLGAAVSRQSSSYMSQEEYLKTIASRLLYSRGCGLFYLSLLAASLVEMIWILHPWVSPGHEHRLSYPTSPVFFCVELYLTLGLFGETSLRIVRQRAAFWLQCGNVFDAMVCALSVLSFVLYVDELSQDLEVAVLVVMAGWVALRLARLLSVARTLHRQRSTSSSLDVNFAEHATLRRGCSGDEEEGEPISMERSFVSADDAARGGGRRSPGRPKQHDSPKPHPKPPRDAKTAAASSSVGTRGAASGGACDGVGSGHV